MNTSPLPIDPDDRRPWWIYISGGLGLLVLLAILFSLRGDDPVVDNEKERTSKQRSEQELGLEEFEHAMAASEPDELGVSSTREHRVRDLRRWMKLRLPIFERQLGMPLTSDSQLVAKLASPEMQQRIDETEITLRDISHIRNSSMSRHIASSLTKGITDPVKQVVSLFDYINRQVLPLRSPTSIPSTPYQTLLMGRGDAEQRAWLFADLLRQLSFDAVIIEPQESAKVGGDAAADEPSPSDNGPQKPLIVGVIVPRDGTNSVYLFDVEHQTPIPAKSEEMSASATVELPATLAEVLADDALLRRLDLKDFPYPLSSKQLEQVSIRLIGTSSQWSSRMAIVDAVDARNVVLFDGLGSSKLRTPGAYDRVVAAGAEGHWTPDDISLWDYPEAQSTAYEIIAPALEKGVYTGPSSPELDQATAYFADVLRQPDITWQDKNRGDREVHSKTLLDARHLHLMGRPGDAMIAYGRVIATCSNQYEQYEGCIETAAYWTELARIEREAAPLTQNTAEAVLRLLILELDSMSKSRAAYRKDLWIDGIIQTLAQIAALSGNYGFAVQRATELPMTFGRAYLVSRWVKQIPPPEQGPTAGPPTSPPVGPLRPTPPVGPLRPEPSPSTPETTPTTTPESTPEPAPETPSKPDSPPESTPAADPAPPASGADS